MVTIFKDTTHAPEMAFTLISISRLDGARFSVTFSKGIKNPKGTTIATIPHSNRLYKITAGKCKNPTKMANTASVKMSVTEAHRKLGHISISAIRHAILKGFITGININFNSEFDFCKACTKAKSAHQLFPKESKTRAKNFGECVHWDLWNPALVKSINGNYYMAARIDDVTRWTKLYFQEKKSQTYESYKKMRLTLKIKLATTLKLAIPIKGENFCLHKWSSPRYERNKKGTYCAWFTTTKWSFQKRYENKGWTSPCPPSSLWSTLSSMGRGHETLDLAPRSHPGMCPK